MRMNGQNTTSGILHDCAIRFGMPQNSYVCEMVAENAISRTIEACLHCATEHAQSGRNTTAGFRFDYTIRSGMVEKYELIFA